MPTIRVIDLESTGTEDDAQICEAGYRDLFLTEKRIGAPVSWLCGVTAMPPDARAVHHISVADVAGMEPFHQDRLLTGGIDAIASHGIDFDAKFIKTTLPLICTYKAVLRAWPNAPSHSNQAIRYYLEDLGLLSLDRQLASPAHRAAPDAYVTAHILAALFEAGFTGKQMVGWTREPRLLPTCPIGKFRGRPWPEVEFGFLEWMTRQPDMESDLKWNAQREINRRREKP